ncbi:MAG: hypothetical protein M3N34_06490 [Pseudomonadota bacterium]|nr:hypothetical protein [Pseudomonadota bacterium]
MVSRAETYTESMHSAKSMDSDSKHSKYQSLRAMAHRKIAAKRGFMAHDWRVIAIAGVHNLRDYGGDAVAGKRLIE